MFTTRAKAWLCGMMVLVCSAMPCMAYAAKMPESFAVTFQCATSDSSTVFSGEAFSIYKVADADGAVRNAFSNVAESADEAVYAQALAQTAMSVAADASFSSDGTGVAELTLEPGVYLVIGDKVTQANVTYTPVPFVLDLTDENLLSSFTSYVKYTSDSNVTRDKATLQTDVMSLAAVAASLMLASTMMFVAMVLRSRA